MCFCHCNKAVRLLHVILKISFVLDFKGNYSITVRYCISDQFPRLIHVQVYSHFADSQFAY